MRVDAIKQAAFRRSGNIARAAPAVETAERQSESHALVVTAPAPVNAAYTLHHQAAFLAHLIATKEQAPQTRERRRAEPEEAIAAYRAVLARA
jgi:hypothetical protein